MADGITDFFQEYADDNPRQRKFETDEEIVAARKELDVFWREIEDEVQNTDFLLEDLTGDLTEWDFETSKKARDVIKKVLSVIVRKFGYRQEVVDKALDETFFYFASVTKGHFRPPYNGFFDNEETRPKMRQQTGKRQIITIISNGKKEDGEYQEETITIMHELGHLLEMNESTADLFAEVVFGTDRRHANDPKYDSTFDYILLERVGHAKFWKALRESEEAYKRLWDENIGEIQYDDMMNLRGAIYSHHNAKGDNNYLAEEIVKTDANDTVSILSFREVFDHLMLEEDPQVKKTLQKILDKQIQFIRNLDKKSYQKLQSRLPEIRKAANACVGICCRVLDRMKKHELNLQLENNDLLR